MAKFTNQPVHLRSPIQTIIGSTSFTFEGGTAFPRDAKSDLFLLAVTNMIGEDTFYEKATDRDSRFVALIHAVTKEDPKWVADFARWLRNTANMRSASIVVAAEYLAAGGDGARQMVRSVLVRPDEPAEMLAYWQLTRGRNLPAALKRGVADAVTDLYTEKAALKYDGRCEGGGYQSQYWHGLDDGDERAGS